MGFPYSEFSQDFWLVLTGGRMVLANGYKYNGGMFVTMLWNEAPELNNSLRGWQPLTESGRGEDGLPIYIFR